MQHAAVQISSPGTRNWPYPSSPHRETARERSVTRLTSAARAIRGRSVQRSIIRLGCGIADARDRGKGWKPTKNTQRATEPVRVSKDRSNHSRGLELSMDQICINQENTKERNHQVAQMGALYSTAQTTILWPGRLDVSGDYDLECHEQELSSPLIPPEHMETILAKHDPQRLISTDNRGDPQGLRRLLGTLTGATLMRLMLQRYWRRLWVTQEIVLAARVRIIIADSTHALEDWDSALKVVWLSELPAIQYL
jgi:hypothetical protein